jgi:hypothetical protein
VSRAQHARAVVGGLTRRNAPPEKIEQARAALKAAGLESRIREAVSTWPPLTAEVRADLAVLLLSPAGGDRAAT